MWQKLTIVEREETKFSRNKIEPAQVPIRVLPKTQARKIPAGLLTFLKSDYFLMVSNCSIPAKEYGQSAHRILCETLSQPFQSIQEGCVYWRWVIREACRISQNTSDSLCVLPTIEVQFIVQGLEACGPRRPLYSLQHRCRPSRAVCPLLA
jgi:hypothetical protein